MKFVNTGAISFSYVDRARMQASGRITILTTIIVRPITRLTNPANSVVKEATKTEYDVVLVK